MIRILLLFLSWVMLCLMGTNVMYMTASRVWQWEFVTSGMVAMLFGMFLFVVPFLALFELYRKAGGEY
ncbi:hypothetical protein IH575_04545 [Candidatus Dojkabacteria bacterium]|nr:hypothetical protein [Candidatus Dojkabacteria bacterium]